jgi:hypothetical protein
MNGVNFMAANKNAYIENGISTSKTSLKVGDSITVTYNGLLANCGADSITMHIGYGDGWENKEFIPMEYDNGIFKASLVVDYSGSLNVAFKDSAENWDNNSGSDYTFKVSMTKAEKTEKETAVEKKTKTAKTSKTEKASDKKTSKKTTVKDTKKKA